MQDPHPLHQNQPPRLRLARENVETGGVGGQRLLAEDVLPRLQSVERLPEVRDVRCGDVDRVDRGIGQKPLPGIGRSGDSALFCVEFARLGFSGIDRPRDNARRQMKRRGELPADLPRSDDPDPEILLRTAPYIRHPFFPFAVRSPGSVFLFKIRFLPVKIVCFLLTKYYCNDTILFKVIHAG